MSNNNTIFFEKLFSDYSDVVYRLAFYKTNDKEVAEDITQDAFLRLWNTVSKDQDISNPKSYIYQITRNLITDYYRKNKANSLEDSIENGLDINSPEDQIIKTDIAIMKSVIDRLDETYREPLYLKYIEGFRVQEIAEMLQLSENIVSVRINRAQQKLREYFS